MITFKKNEIICKFMMRFAVAFIAVVCFLQVALADNPQGIVNSINRVTGGYDLVATISDNTVTVTGTLYGAPSTSDYLTLNIDAGVKVIWKATLQGSPSGNYALINISGGSGIFEVQSGGSIENTGTGKAITNNSTCTINISDGIVKAVCSNSGRSSSTIYNASSGTINVSGGTVSAKGGVEHVSCSNAIYNSSGTVNVSGGSVKTDVGTAIGSFDSGTVSISGGTMSATNGTAIDIRAPGTLKIVGGTVSGKRAIYSTSKKTIVSGGTVSASNGSAIFIQGGNLDISGNAKITAANTPKESGTIHLYFAGSTILNINGGTVENTTKGVAIYNDHYLSAANTVNINGGTILSGIYNKGGEVNISGGTINAGISNSGNVKITGGTISVNADYDAIFNTERNYTLVLGGNPTITGKISIDPEKLSILTIGTRAFAPDQKIYTLSFKEYAVGNLAVMNGREFINSFRLDDPDWILMGSAAHLAIVPAKGSDVYMAGSDRNANPFVAKLWKNGKVQNLSNGKHHAEANSVFVSGSDVYVAGHENNKAVLWKNGIMQHLTDGTNNTVAKSVFVSGNDVYVAGYRYTSWQLNDYIAVFWKNGVEQNLIYDVKYRSTAYSVFVSGSDVYVAGSVNQKAALWKNGTIQNFADGTNQTEAYSVFVSDNDVYVAGHSDRTAVLWKNSIAQNLNDGTSQAYAYSVFVSGSDVYVAGKYAYDAVLWKNGVMQNLTNGQNDYNADAGSVCVSNGDVYVAGWQGGRAVLWKNGVAQYLTDGSKGQEFVTSVFVVEK